MKKFSYETKRDGIYFKYVVTAENKDEARAKIKKICGEEVLKVKEEEK